ncbi:MAG: efflux RND transporter periplasmic adaptor subunit [Verrucomicrobia bacterium]|nr:efflux RND transporter periplasmic adaptor subunit [Verrucomicrobiota bacterium]
MSLLIAAAMLTDGCGKKKQEGANSQNLPTAAVRVQTVESKSSAATDEVVGTVRAKLRASIEAKASGHIEKMPVALGQLVKTGDLLAQLDTREIQARLDQALAARQPAENDLKRLTVLLKQGAVTQAEFDAAQARQRAASAAVTEAESQLGYMTIVAPFDGVISRKFADVGDLALPGRPLLEIEKPDQLRFEADVPEALIGYIHLGDRLTVRTGAQDAGVQGVVSEISPIADPASRTSVAKLDLPANAGLRVGQFARALVVVAERKALIVPASAVVQRGQMELVFVVANKLAQLRIVKTGRRTGNEVELVSGVSAGERIAVKGAEQLRDGQPVAAQP